MSEVSSLGAITDVISSGFGGGTVLVIGDLMLDRYVWGDVNRISPEAPVPVVRARRTSEVGGGAANVALNLSSLGLNVRIIGIVGDDIEGLTLRRLLESSGVSTDAVEVVQTRPTTTKTRVIGEHQQMLRIDSETDEAAPADVCRRLLASARSLMTDAAAIVLSDYAKGVLSEETCAELISGARKQNCPVYVDSKATSYDKFRGATAITPNLTELARAVSIPQGPYEALVDAAHDLRRRLSLEFIVLTRGEMGIALIDASGTHVFAAATREVYDVSGAGDTVMALVAASQVAGLDLEVGLRLANLGAGIVISRLGTSVVSRRELCDAVQRDLDAGSASKLHTWASIVELTQHWRSAGQKVVFTNGCFDLLHVGHVTYLENAKRLGDRLVVGVNTDRSVRALKGPDRPIVTERDRAAVLASLESIDAVVLFDEDTPLSLINTVKPEVLAKGADYSEDQVVGAREVRSWGGQVSLLPLVAGQSTTRLLAKATEPQESAGGDFSSSGSE